mmetsp:Transcript_49943/g.83169  ORF Transcript_49943/g.83169 Transcript_49943/m.83169 type:complete len:210 (-) Transcript_49943:110-739(-)|eukprot:CAMPEP_0202695406 /NCGR_PEP_ID=MMETSP1385-20130828/9006_1 /ASSEMBLY_ACC=CAM_ASM_000861 /TAXON_ID=933848 /ORGANISM="Elphidium margaritaceum" /LENGTH=209 /DNA_ID=CAMNT_0049351425 /DNA_START=35 /DNA_END=664 /DNA_ORIENTATION=+
MAKRLDYGPSTLNITEDIKEIVKTPKGEKFNEWLAVNTLDFFNEITMLYGIITDHCTQETCPCMSAGPKYEYLWADGIKHKKPIKVSAPEYVELLLNWVEDQINNEQIFPMQKGNVFPKNFKTIVKTIFKRLFRVYGHIYHSHLQKYIQMDAEAHLNSCFKHFYFFIVEHKLLDTHGVQPLQPIIDVIVRKDALNTKLKSTPKLQNLYN